VRHRANPAFSVNSALGDLGRAFRAAGFLEAGKIATNAVTRAIPFGPKAPKSGSQTDVLMFELINAGKAAAVGAGLSVLARMTRFVKREDADMILVGAILAPTERLLAMVPGVGPLVAAPAISGYAALNGYGPEARGARAAQVARTLRGYAPVSRRALPARSPVTSPLMGKTPYDAFTPQT